ncbi:MAG TPA: PRC-barrel domain-containing protein [Candidatus Binatia bacterium]|jgi:sporulation protein YlmC with PRC-barrel domain|nr:PRC-barrel domain-containing protein [Candidatus Binatia bacterium]
MAQSDENATLVKLSDSNLRLADPAEDIRGRKVLDKEGEEIGDVDDMFVDDHKQKVRFLQVASGGFLGFGETTFLIPVDVVTHISGDAVHINQARQYVAGAPRYNPNLVDRHSAENIYDYYGYAPYWGSGYVYPPYPYYP